MQSPTSTPAVDARALAAQAARAAVAASLPSAQTRSAFRDIQLLVIHCSATASGKALSGPAEVVIDGWHKARGFARGAAAVARFNLALGSIGYHFVIDLDGRIATGRGLAEVGAHVAGFNARSVGICMVGGAEPVARYTPAQWLALRALVSRLAGELRIAPQPVKPGAPMGVCGHRDLSADLNGDGQVTSREWLKTCPGFDVAAWLAGGMEPLTNQLAGA